MPDFTSGGFNLPEEVRDCDRWAVFARIFARSDDTAALDADDARTFDTGATRTDEEGFPIREGTTAVS